jgi:hypothetical protein
MIKESVDKFRISFTSMDFQSQKESDKEVLIKIIRLIANIITVDKIGSDLYMNRRHNFIEIAKKLIAVLRDKQIGKDNVSPSLHSMNSPRK